MAEPAPELADLSERLYRRRRPNLEEFEPLLVAYRAAARAAAERAVSRFVAASLGPWLEHLHGGETPRANPWLDLVGRGASVVAAAGASAPARQPRAARDAVPCYAAWDVLPPFDRAFPDQPILTKTDFDPNVFTSYAAATTEGVFSVGAAVGAAVNNVWPPSGPTLFGTTNWAGAYLCQWVPFPGPLPPGLFVNLSVEAEVGDLFDPAAPILLDPRDGDGVEGMVVVFGLLSAWMFFNGDRATASEVFIYALASTNTSLDRVTYRQDLLVQPSLGRFTGPIPPEGMLVNVSADLYAIRVGDTNPPGVVTDAPGFAGADFRAEGAPGTLFFRPPGGPMVIRRLHVTLCP